MAVVARLGGTGRWIVACGALGLVLAAVITGSSESAPTRLPSPVDLGGTLPAAFVANRGQLPAGVRFATAGAGYAFALDPDGVRIALAGPSGKVRLALRFVAPGGRTRITGADALGARVSYFLGRDPARWRAGLPTYSTVVYHDVWPGVDVAFRARDGALKYEFRLRPGASVASVRLAYEGAARLSTDARGNLRIRTAGRVLVDERPSSYQTIGGKRVDVASRFRLAGRSFGFAVGVYDRRFPLVVDPGIVYSTFLGGSSDDTGLGIAAGVDGSAYVTGQTASLDFPATPGASDTAYNGSGDVFVAKLAPDGSGLVYAAFLGGEALDEGRGVAIDGQGNAYVTGFTSSPDFPTLAADDSSLSGARDAFLAELDPTGTRLAFSTYVGGSGDDRGLAIAVGASGVHITGETDSPDFRVTPGAFDTTANGDYDVFVTKTDAAGQVLYSTLVGGPGFDDGLAIAVGGNGNAYVTGKASAGFPTTAEAFDRTANGDFDVFVAQVSATGSTLSYSTLIGGESWDEGLGIAVDGDGNAYTTGNVQSADWPTTAGAWDRTLSGSVDMFVTKVNASGSELVYSTFLGGSEWDEGDGLGVDATGRAVVTGHLGSSDFPTTADAFQRSPGGVVDAFLTIVDPVGSGLDYSTYVGGSDWDGGFALALDQQGSAYIGGSTSSSDFPTTAGSLDTSVNGGTDVFVTKIGSVEAPPPVPDFALTAEPTRQAIVRGTSAVYLVTIAPSKAFDGLVTLDVSGLPDGASASFLPNPSTATSILTIETTSETKPGQYPLMITGTSGELVRTTTAALDVTH